MKEIRKGSLEFQKPIEQKTGHANNPLSVYAVHFHVTFQPSNTLLSLKIVILFPFHWHIDFNVKDFSNIYFFFLNLFRCRW